MCRKSACFASVVLALGLMTNISYGQTLGVYAFDGGGDGASWDDAANWEQVTDPNGNPISGNPATPPDAVTSADIPLLGVSIDSTQPGQTALDVRIGAAAGAGSLTISGGDLSAGRDVYVGSDVGGVNSGLLTVNSGVLGAGDDITLGGGSAGVMSMNGGAVSTGDDFFINANSSLAVNGGTLSIADRLVMDSNAGLVVDGGGIVADDDVFFFGGSQITVNSGSMIVADKLRFDDVLTTGKLTINGGLVRSQEFGFEAEGDGSHVMNGTVEINGDGVYQSKAPGEADPISQLSVAQALDLINAGVFITSEASPLHLGVNTVIVPDFFGNSNVAFTQISIVPEPTSMLLLGLGGLGLLWRSRKSG